MSCSQRKIRSAEHCLKLERWQGPPHKNKVTQYEMSFKVRLVSGELSLLTTECTFNQLIHGKTIIVRLIHNEYNLV